MFKVEPGIEPSVANPWDCKNLEDFLFYNCPECHYKGQDSDEFLIHCQSHPMAESFISNFYEIAPHQVVDESEEIIDDHMEEYTDPDVYVEPTPFVDCNIDENDYYEQEQDPDEEALIGHQIPVQKIKRNNGRKSWEQEVEEGWQEFQAFINHSPSFNSQKICDFLRFSFKSKKMATSSVVNLKSRLSIAYKNKTGRNFHLDFPQVQEFCKTINVPNHKLAYQKKKNKDWLKCKNAIGKGVHFSQQDLEQYFQHLSSEQKYSISTLRQILAAVAKNYEQETKHNFKKKFPHMFDFVSKLESD